MILVAIGANLPGPRGEPPLATCEWAVDRLGRLPGLRLAAVSRWYETAPEPPSDQPNYVNGAVRLEGAAEPEALLAALHGIEAEAGRVRTVRNAARPLDLDLIAMDEPGARGAAAAAASAGPPARLRAAAAAGRGARVARPGDRIDAGRDARGLAALHARLILHRSTPSLR